MTASEAMTLEDVAAEMRRYVDQYITGAYAKRWADAIDAHLPRAAEPVYQIMLCTDERYSKNEWREVSYSEFKAAQGKPFHATRILYSRPGGLARDAKVNELTAATQAYFDGYCVDEADDWFDGSDARAGENTGCTREQHDAAKRLRDALAAMAQEGE